MLSSPDADLVRRDPALPGLAAVLEPEELVAVARAQGVPLEIAGARPVYLRYKPATSCLVGYATMEGTEPTLFYATAYSADSAKLDKARQRKRVPWLSGGGRFVLDGQATEICFFPADDHLPVLIDLLDPHKARSFLDVAAAGVRPWTTASGFEPRVLAYKPERRCTVAVVTDSTPVAVIKAYTRAGFASARTRAAMLQHSRGVGIQRLVSAYERRGLLFFEWLEGRSLGESILRGEATGSDVRETGYALAELHGLPLPELPRRDQRQEQVLEELVATVRVLCPEAVDDAASIAGRAASFVRADESPLVLVHGDFYAKQAIVQSNRVALLDLDQAAVGMAAFDLGNFIAHLELEVARGKIGAEAAAAHSRSFLAGYASHRALPSESLIAANTALSLLALAHHPFRRHLADWQSLISTVIARAGEILDEHHIRPAATTRQAGGSDAVDAAIPWLAEALSPASAKRALDGRVNGERGHERVANVRATRLIRHKAGRRCVIEYDVDVECAGQIVEETLVGKVRARGFDSASYDIIAELRRAGFTERAGDGVAVPQPRGRVDAFNMWLSAKVAGAPATCFVLDDDSEWLGRRVAEVAHKLSESGVIPRRVHTMTDELRILADRLRQLRFRRPDLADRVFNIEAACQRLAEGVHSDERRPIHRDFYGDQLLVDGDRIWILDLDLFCLGDPALDIGNFLGHVSELALRRRGNPLAGAAFERALLERSAQLAGDSIVERAEVFQTLTLVRHLWISTEKPERRALTDPLLEVCESRIASVARLRSAGALP